MFPSELASGLIKDRDVSKEHPSELRFIPARRLGGEEEMVGTVLYFASRAGAVSGLDYCYPFFIATGEYQLRSIIFSLEELSIRA